jgi:hypothetical protein
MDGTHIHLLYTFETYVPTRAMHINDEILKMNHPDATLIYIIPTPVRGRAYFYRYRNSWALKCPWTVITH